MQKRLLLIFVLLLAVLPAHAQPATDSPWSWSIIKHELYAEDFTKPGCTIAVRKNYDGLVVSAYDNNSNRRDHTVLLSFKEGEATITSQDVHTHIPIDDIDFEMPGHFDLINNLCARYANSLPARVRKLFGGKWDIPTPTVDQEITESAVGSTLTEYAWYQKPKDEQAELKFRVFVAPDSPKEEEVVALINRARDRGSYVGEAKDTSITKGKVTIEGSKATFERNENAQLQWYAADGTKGRLITQTENSHEYRLEKIGERWLVKADIFVLQ